MAYSTRDHSVNGYWFWFAHLMVLGQERPQQHLLEISRQVADSGEVLHQRRPGRGDPGSGWWRAGVAVSSVPRGLDWSRRRLSAGRGVCQSFGEALSGGSAGERRLDGG